MGSNDTFNLVSAVKQVRDWLGTKTFFKKTQLECNGEIRWVLMLHRDVLSGSEGIKEG